MFASCKQKKKTMSGEDSVNLQEFVDFYPQANLPFIYGDTSLQAKTHDSLLISKEIFNQFTPDSILKNEFKTEKLKLYAIGKFKDKSDNLYLMSKAVGGGRRELLITAFNGKHEFLSGFTLLKNKQSGGVSTSIIIDPLFNINMKKVKQVANDQEISGDDVYVLNSAAKKFMLVMTDSLGDEAELINPIDTLSRKYKYAGDYGSGKKNIISIRDDSHPERVQFFIHLEDKNSDCSGELRGEGIITSGNTFEYRKAGDPCVLLFSFTKNSLKLSEVKGCGSRMGALKCSFNGNYPKKKETKMPVSATESK
ncbi:MAG TPA: hypothetical protein PLY92_09050 [Niabella sp.]|nr:hypothetical protein [Niabella sp.]